MERRIDIPQDTFSKWKLKWSHGDITAIYKHYENTSTPVGRSALKTAFNEQKANPTVINLITTYYEQAI